MSDKFGTPKEHSATLVSGCVALRNQLQPHFNDNVSPLVFDYKFFTDLESFAKKEREKALKKVLDLATDPVKEGVVIGTPRYNLELSVIEANSFDKEVFIDAILETYAKDGVQRHKLRELATTSVKTSQRKSYKAIEKEA